MNLHYNENFRRFIIKIFITVNIKIIKYYYY